MHLQELMACTSAVFIWHLFAIRATAAMCRGVEMGAQRYSMHPEAALAHLGHSQPMLACSTLAHSAIPDCMRIPVAYTVLTAVGHSTARQ